MIPRIAPITAKRLKQLISARNTDKYRLWKESVLARDNHKCQWPGCGKTEELQVHHIMMYSKAKHLRTDPMNGITLCRGHHEGIKSKEQAYASMFFVIVRKNMGLDGKEKDSHNS